MEMHWQSGIQKLVTPINYDFIKIRVMYIMYYVQQPQREWECVQKWIIQLLYDPRRYYVDILPLKCRIAPKIAMKMKKRRDWIGLIFLIVFFIKNVVRYLCDIFVLSVWYLCSIFTKGAKELVIIILMIPVIPNHGHHQYCHPHLLSNTTTTTKDTYDNANKINNPNPWLCSSSSCMDIRSKPPLQPKKW